MVVPDRHVGSLGDLSDDEGAELWSALRRAVAALEDAFGPEGINLGANLGEAAGAGIPRHLHLHAVPRWVGDTNFMTAVAGARVLPETLAATWQRLHAGLARMSWSAPTESAPRNRSDRMPVFNQRRCDGGGGSVHAGEGARAPGALREGPRAFGRLLRRGARLGGGLPRRRRASRRPPSRRVAPTTSCC